MRLGPREPIASDGIFRNVTSALGRIASAPGANPTSRGRKATKVSSETFETPSQPGVAERALDTATDMSRTLGEMVGTLSAAVDRLSEAARDARRPGTALSTVSAITREAPLASLFVAFLFGVAVARRR